MTRNELAVWAAVAEWLLQRGVVLEGGTGVELQTRLFHRPQGIVEAALPNDPCSWLPVPGFGFEPARPPRIVAFRLRQMEKRFGRLPRPTVNELLALASAVPGKVRTLRAVRRA